MTHNVEHKRRRKRFLLVMVVLFLLFPFPLYLPREIALAVRLFGGPQYGACYIGCHLRVMGRLLAAMRDVHPRMPHDQLSYDKIENPDSYFLHPELRRKQLRVYYWNPTSKYFRISVRVSEDLPLFYVDSSNQTPRYAFTDCDDRQRCLTNFVNSLRAKRVTSLSRHNDMFYALPLLYGFGPSTQSLDFLQERMTDWRETWSIRILAREMYDNMTTQIEDINRNADKQ